MARKKWLPPSCAGYKRIKAPAFFVRKGYDVGPTISYYKNGKVVIRCTSMHCAVHREIRPSQANASRGRRGYYTYGYDAGSLASACSSPGGSEESFGSHSKKRRRRRSR